MRNAWIIAAAAAALAVGGATWLVSHRSVATEKPDLALLRVTAVDSCRCARQATDETGRKKCWSRFDAQIARLPEATTGGTYCDPIASRYICWGQAPENCVVTEYKAHLGAVFCSAAEAAAAESAWLRATERFEAGDRSVDPDAVVRRMAADFARGDRPAKPAPGQGCAG